MVGAGDRCPPTAQRTHPSSRGLRAATESLSQCALGDGEAMHVIGKHRGAVTQAAADQALFAWLTPAAYLESVEADAAHGERLHAVVVADPDDGAQVIAECASQFLGRDIGDRGDIVQACQPGAQRVRQRQLAVALGQLLTRPGSSWPRAVVSTRQLPRPAAFARYIAASAPASARSAVPLPTPKIEHQHRAVTVLAPPRCQMAIKQLHEPPPIGQPGEIVPLRQPSPGQLSLAALGHIDQPDDPPESQRRPSTGWRSRTTSTPGRRAGRRRARPDRLGHCDINHALGASYWLVDVGCCPGGERLRFDEVQTQRGGQVPEHR
jgi:hypothetical protein